MLRNQVKNLTRTFMFALAMMIIPLAGAQAQGGDIEKLVTSGCKTEIKNFCSKVKIGQGRLAACLYAHEDKISRQCGIAVLDAMDMFVEVVETLRDIADDCGEDLDKYCSQVKMGGGRLYKCLNKNKTKIRKRCVSSLTKIKLIK